MVRVGPYEFRFAETEADFDAVHRLNYATFVREIPQHADPGTGVLVDKFHTKNRYVLAVKSGTVVGMLAANAEPPFSVTARLPDPKLVVRGGPWPVEIRLLAVEPAERHSPVAAGLVWTLYQDSLARGVSHFVISGVVSQQKLYEHLGFSPLGPPVGTGPATFVPMDLTLETLERTMRIPLERWKNRLARREGPAADAPKPVCLLPGPVALAPAVEAAFREPIVYHRSDDFLPLFTRVKSKLARMVGGVPAGLFVGSGTLGNDAVAATLAASPDARNGLVLVTGEFGGRLAKQARRHGLDPAVLTGEWGTAWDLAAVERHFAASPPGGWVWGVHHETSTGVLNDLPGLVALAARFGKKVCVDCVSSLGTVPVNLSGVHMATAASGKALGSVAGIAVVFARPEALRTIDRDRLPEYLDVPATVSAAGPRFTLPSPLVRALDVALDRFDGPDAGAERFAELRALGGYVRERLTAAGFTPLAPAAVANPSIVTFAPPAGETTAAFVARCLARGFQVAGQSGYLAERRLVQVAVMGAVTRPQIDPLFDVLRG